ncbi:abortive infection bacteriophage resistance protein [Clostridium botulinum]|nr:abortive infection bacteriophage resistance protein [Clostridium botulinum]NFB21225.1 abortive infection bacteriophage resistance protein [Clostridium botulinum]NFT58440.1 abortive infection bacteriophage resistance protein [Clostridium botulinum]
MGVFMKKDTELKEPKTFEQQLNILEDRGMIIEDREEAIKVLTITNYYRLTAYALQFKQNDNYDNKVSFNTMYKLYKFDKRLRHLILEILESIEISLRTYMAYTLSINYGPEAHNNPDIFKDINLYMGYDDIAGNHRKGLIDEIKSEVNKNRKELFIKHHLHKYNGHFPIWAIVEIFSFGMLSRMYANLNITDQKAIAREGFSTNYKLLESWLNNLAYVRNICAHYGRLYNKKLAINPKVHNKYIKYNLDLKRLFITILSIKELTINCDEWNTFKIQLEALFEEYQAYINLKLIGFPYNWKDILSSV